MRSLTASAAAAQQAAPGATLAAGEAQDGDPTSRLANHNCWAIRLNIVLAFPR